MVCTLKTMDHQCQLVSFTVTIETLVCQLRTPPTLFCLDFTIFFLALFLSCFIVFLQDSPRAFPSARGHMTKKAHHMLF